MHRQNSYFFLWLPMIAVLTLAGCASTGSGGMTPLQIQAFQTHEFEAPKKTVFASVVSVFQDLGYIVESADVETGFITSASASVNKTGFWQALGGATSSGKTRATAFVEEVRPNLVTVRLNFVDTENMSTAYGQASSEDTPIVDPEPYKVAFDKIEEAVFIRVGAS
jgi:hypothetical protein